MAVKKVWAVYFSATGTTKKAVTRLARHIGAALKADYAEHDFTLPGARVEPLRFSADDVVVFGTPVYAGRVPNVLLPYLDTLEGGGALAVPVSLFGNRNYDNALIELRNILDRKGFLPVAAGAFVGEHSFSTTLGGGRPDDRDMALIDDFAGKTAATITRIMAGEKPELIAVKGDPEAGYYRPQGSNGEFIDIRKVKPVVFDNCTDCKICADVCPMGSISHDDVREYTGICIKCGACIKKCPEHARGYDDPNYLFHKEDLEQMYARRAEPDVFV